MPQSTSKPTVAKPKRPKGCPLFPHATRRWAKKVRQKLHYFGPWNDLDGALQRWAEQKDDLLAGREPNVAKRGQATVKDMVDGFLNSRRRLVETGVTV